MERSGMRSGRALHFASAVLALASVAAFPDAVEEKAVATVKAPDADVSPKRQRRVMRLPHERPWQHRGSSQGGYVQKLATTEEDVASLSVAEAKRERKRQARLARAAV